MSNYLKKLMVSLHTVTDNNNNSFAEFFSLNDPRYDCEHKFQWSDISSFGLILKVIRQFQLNCIL